jgi:hypothetical protein
LAVAHAFLAHFFFVHASVAQFAATTAIFAGVVALVARMDTKAVRTDLDTLTEGWRRKRGQADHYRQSPHFSFSSIAPAFP